MGWRPLLTVEVITEPPRPPAAKRRRWAEWSAVAVSVVALALSAYGTFFLAPQQVQHDATQRDLRTLRSALTTYQLALGKLHAVLNTYSASGRAGERSAEIATSLSEYAGPGSRLEIAAPSVLALEDQAAPIHTCLRAVTRQANVLAVYLGPRPTWGEVDGKIEASLPTLTSAERRSQGNVDAQTDRALEATSGLTTAVDEMLDGHAPSRVRCPHLHVK